ncbi:C39 family peptidase [Bacillus sp. BRMEA1]|uniref:C39 family peptidase n=1 Tax=Neobacillus endophyticus TaxID=2738405 RepID=UPI0015679CF9|nr:C39 family peptidase [Neobacillus endophyticus]NRD77192.1 C39 family peptidase [Neobacillus endophyticus]
MRSKLWLMGVVVLLVISYPLSSRQFIAHSAWQGEPIRFSGKITDQTTIIKGTASPNTTIRAETKAGLLNSTKADGTGNFILSIPKQTSNTILKITDDHKRLVNVKISATGWIKEGENWYFLNGNGEKQTGWIQYQSKRYFLNQNGVMEKGWIHDARHWYFLDSTGAMQTDWVEVNGKRYDLNSNGVMLTGWVQNSKGKFLLGPDGAVSSAILDVPIVSQLPELPRGCEITSLTMLLKSAGIEVDKMTLSSQIERDPTPYSRVNGQINYGNPNKGFVGDMYNINNLGYGVYHGPIAKLANRYMPNRIIDFTGSKFETMFQYLNKGKPVWVIINTLFDTTPSQYWVTWNTPEGRISINGKEHSVLVTGYDSRYIYFNDPLSGIKNDKAPLHSFKSGWEQMGSQAISYR